MNIRKSVLLTLAALGAPAWAQTCQPSATTPYMNINGTSAWTTKSSATLNAGSRVVLGPQPFNGTWSWSGCGTSGNSREQTLKLSASCTATATFTNTCGAKTTQAFNFTVWPAPAANTAKFIMVDQFGYLPEMKKVAVLRWPRVGYDNSEFFWPGKLKVVNVATNATVLEWWPQQWKGGQTDDSSGDMAWTFDFSEVTTPGTYEIVDIGSGQRSARFEIGDNVYRNVLAQAFRTFLYQRAGQAKSAGHVGAGYADDASHLKPGQDHEARRWFDKNNAGTARDLRGGWYDAGDLNKYTSWAAGYVQELMDAYLQRPSVWTDDFNIPESYNGIPDILDEARWGMDWLKRMQNADGGVLSIVGLAGASPPSAATAPSYYGDASTAATLAAAAAFAQGAKVFGSMNNAALQTYAADLQTRAKRAWDWAWSNQNVVFYNNDAARGTSGLGAGQQETDDRGRILLRVSAAIRLFALTGDPTYRAYVDANYQRSSLMQDWMLAGENATSSRELLYYASLPGATASVASAIRTRYQQLVTRSDYPTWGAVDSEKDPYRAYIAHYNWASNAVKANAGTIFFDDQDHGLSGRSATAAASAAAGYLHYLHGVNPLGKVYLTNMVSFGAENSVNQMWHTWFPDGSAKWDSAATSTYGPAPGFLIGGPTNTQWDWADGCPGVSAQCARPTPPYGQPQQKSYLDFNTGWPLNSWSISENSNGYQTAYLRLLARFVK